jgi:hypothetical protein
VHTKSQAPKNAELSGKTANQNGKFNGREVHKEILGLYDKQFSVFSFQLGKVL